MLQNFKTSLLFGLLINVLNFTPNVYAESIWSKISTIALANAHVHSKAVTTQDLDSDSTAKVEQKAFYEGGISSASIEMLHLARDISWHSSLALCCLGKAIIEAAPFLLEGAYNATTVIKNKMSKPMEDAARTDKFLASAAILALPTVKASSYAALETTKGALKATPPLLKGIAYASLEVAKGIKASLIHTGLAFAKTTAAVISFFKKAST